MLYDIGWTKPRALVERRLRLEVTEKMRPDGSVAVPLDAASLDPVIAMLRAENVASVAICLLHSYANPAHEQAVAAAVRDALPDVAISVSSEILPEIKEYPRTSTTVINAYVQPVVRAYITALDARLRDLGIEAPLQLMQSNGGLASAAFAAESPAHIIESGPAAGVVGGAALARRLNEPRIVTFDMGGTTAKAGLVENGEVLRTEAIEVGGGVMAGSRLLVGAGYMLKLPAIDLAEVGAGGGSICRLDSAGAPKVGPESAGADPGPGLLRTRRHRADDHRLQSGAGVSGSGRPDRRHHAAGPGGRARRDPARPGGAAAAVGRGSGARDAASGVRDDDARDPGGVGGAGTRSAAVRACWRSAATGRCSRPGSPRNWGFRGSSFRRCRACSAPSDCWSPMPNIMRGRASGCVWMPPTRCRISEIIAGADRGRGATAGARRLSGRTRQMFPARRGGPLRRPVERDRGRAARGRHHAGD